jgi:response regulator RpfG family c-di-GMP phosphodiesterase
MRVLVADPSAVVRSFLALSLERGGAHVSFADDAAQALEKIRDIDLVIVDSDLPGAGGVELCRRVKEDRLSRHIPVIVLDSQGTGDIVRDAYQAGAGACIPKNQARDKLLEDISQVLMDAALRRDRLVLVVDDSITVRSLVSRSLKEAGFRVMEAENGRAALRLLKESRPDIILSDIDMPEMNGEAFCRAVHKDPGLASIPFVVMSSNDQRPIMRRMLRIGADSYIVKPFNIEQLVITVEKLLSDRLLLLQKEKERLETEQKLMLASITSLCAALEARDPYTRGHSEAVCTIAALIAKGMGLSSEEVDLVRLGGRLHDIGKIGVPDSILLKPGRLSSDEFSVIRRHPAMGGEILRPVPSLAQILPIVLYHHERIDGKGYPEGLQGSSIPLWARITAVGDTYHALTSDRPYRKGMETEQALEIISQAKGTQLCPDCVEAFIAMEPWNSGPAAFAARQGSGAGIIQASTP